MSRRRQVAENDPFSKPNESESDAVSFSEVDQALFGGKLSQIDSGREQIKPIPIHDIYPDPAQPRRVMPSMVRKYWSGTQSVGDLLERWYALVLEESGRHFDLGIYITGKEDPTRPEHCEPVEDTFLHIVDLAASIRRDGLTNAITVTRAGRQYRLETGERRWLAYHLLYHYFDGSDNRPDERERWSKIPARQVETTNVWRQASENNARENLNAISKARQFAVLLMDLLKETDFRPFENFEFEQDFYAQVSDAKRFRVPSGKNDQLMSAIGITSRAAISRFRSFLALPREVWQIGDDYSLPDEVLYQLSLMEPHQAITETMKIVSGQNNFEQKTPASAAMELDYTPGTKRHFSQIARAIQKAGPGKHKTNDSALAYIHELREWLNEQEERIRSYQK
jgi:hypothetical protein